MKIAIVGGGITGLIAGSILSQNHQVTIFEKENILGGLANSFKMNNWQWPLEKYFHHFFASDRKLLNLIKDLNLENDLLFFAPKTSVFVEGKIYRFDNPKSILLFPKLNFLNKIRTGVSAFLFKINPFWKPLEKITAADLLKTTMGEKTYKLIWQPLLKSKFGEFDEEISGAWIWTRINKRSFRLGYLKNGINSLIEALSRKIKKNNGRIFLKSEVTKVRKIKNKFYIFKNERKYNEEFDKVLITSSPETLLKLSNLKKEKNKIEALKSLGCLCLILELRKPFLTDGTYWLNVNDASFPFVAVVEHTNFIDKKFYGNYPLLYVGGYYSLKNPILTFEKEQVLKKFVPFLKKINPDFSSQSILNSWIFKDFYAQPIVTRNYSTIAPKIKTSIPGLYWTSLHHVYPQDRGINYAIELGEKAANEILQS